ncbi:uncharacterized protein LOC143893828 isoform X1 [Temnothorax americanus]|uniref:uncharacterized protein LOC143893828 isoform X1 n=1 Tax=Temnothorax americanus TaxID=1964332 RepID=UPI0040698B81
MSECADGDVTTKEDRGEEEGAWEASGDSGATVRSTQGYSLQLRCCASVGGDRINRHDEPRGNVPQVTKGTLIRELREDIRMEIDPRRKPQITQQLVYRVADRMAASGSFIGKPAHARNITPFSAFLTSVLWQRTKNVLPRTP